VGSIGVEGWDSAFSFENIENLWIFLLLGNQKTRNRIGKKIIKFISIILTMKFLNKKSDGHINFS